MLVSFDYNELNIKVRKTFLDNYYVNYKVDGEEHEYAQYKNRGDQWWYENTESIVTNDDPILSTLVLAKNIHVECQKAINKVLNE